jgi:hypothetical protein
MQFWIRPNDIEDCVIFGRWPVFPSLRLTGRTEAIQVWSLAASNRLTAAALSWNTKPAREKLLGTLNATAGNALRTQPLSALITDKFDCPRLFQTIELVCDDCEVEFKYENLLTPTDPMICEHQFVAATGEGY